MRRTPQGAESLIRLRAGDQGQGFAVVASEIKTLADQSKAATEQVSSIIENTRRWVNAVVMANEQGIKAVEIGVEQSVLAGESISSLSKSVELSSQAASVIEIASDQQSGGVDQVAGAMTSIEQAAKHNLAGSTQLEDSAQKLADLAVELKKIVEEYKT